VLEKTTTAGKLAIFLRKQGRRPLLVAGDIYRPAAIKQLEVIGREIDVPVFSLGDRVNPVAIARGGVEHALSTGRDMVILDTAGRLHVDEALMGELEDLKKELSPQEIMLVVDAMTGQDAVNVAEAFAGRLAITGVILTKLDGDTRGGAALSLRAVTGKPIKFAGVGEKFEALEVFHPDRMASRILGLGDVLSLIEKAQANLDVEKAREMEKKLRSMDFTLEDFVEQLRQVRKMGPLDQLLSMLPGVGAAKGLKDLKIEEKELVRTEAIINSMTRLERKNPTIIDGSRRRRIALGSGTRVQDVNRLLKQYEEMRKLLKQLSSKDKGRFLGGKFPIFK
ncbi:MAG: signal recognition particle protein Srp54, partial [Firmicutes bacterium]|nr:signal recognition particle protein Srp54 [Bacillota bacterium]